MLDKDYNHREKIIKAIEDENKDCLEVYKSYIRLLEQENRDLKKRILELEQQQQRDNVS